MLKPWLLLFAVACWGWSVGAATAADRLPSALEHDPAFPPQRVVHVAPDGLIPLWRDALRADDVETEVVCQVARGAVRLHRLGIAPDSALVVQLAQHLNRRQATQAARLAVAQALVALNAKQYASLLAAQLPSGGRDMAEIVEPALAGWGDRSLGDQWVRRLGDPTASRRSLQLAIHAVGMLGESSAQAGLLALAEEQSQPLTLRLEAAQALSNLTDSGLERPVDRLLAASDASRPAVRLIAATMLARHSGPAAEELLLKLSRDDEPAVAAAAIERLLAINAVALQPRREEMLNSPDAGLRSLGIKLVQRDVGTSGVALLADRLDDKHLDVRRLARRALVDVATSAERRDAVCRESLARLDADAPRRTEQALQVLAALDYEPAAPRMVELLTASDPSVSVTAAWALEQIAAPASAEAIFAHLVAQTERSVVVVEQLAPRYAKGRPPEGSLPDLSADYAQAEHLLLALGRLDYKPADGFLRQFVAKPSADPGGPPPLEVFKQPRPRAAALWALGKIHAGAGTQAPPELLDAIADRLADTTPIPREEPLVRRMAAVSLGRIGDSQSLPRVQEFFDPAAAHHSVGRACGWAIEQLTGQPPPRVATRTVRHVDWFLVPLDP